MWTLHHYVGVSDEPGFTSTLSGIYGHHYRRPSIEQEKDCPLKHVRVNLETSFSPRKPRPKPKQSVIRRLLRGAYGSGFRGLGFRI